MVNTFGMQSRVFINYSKNRLNEFYFNNIIKFVLYRDYNQNKMYIIRQKDVQVRGVVADADPG